MSDEKKSSSPPWDDKQPRPQPLDRQALELKGQQTPLPADEEDLQMQPAILHQFYNEINNFDPLAVLNADMRRRTLNQANPQESKQNNLNLMPQTDGDEAQEELEHKPAQDTEMQEESEDDEEDDILPLTPLLTGYDEELEHKPAQDTEMQEESEDDDEEDGPHPDLKVYRGNFVRRHLARLEEDFPRQNLLVKKGEPLSEDFTEYKMTSDIPVNDLRLHQILEDLDKRSTPETGFFVSEQLYMSVANIVKTLDLRQEDEDGNTSLLLLTKFLLNKKDKEDKKPQKPLVVTANNQPNYVIYLFRLLVLRDLEHGLNNLLHFFSYFKTLGKHNKKNEWYFGEIEEFYAQYEEYINETKDFFDLVKKPASIINEDDYRTYAKFELNLLPYGRMSTYFQSSTVEDWGDKSPAMKKAELVFKLSDHLFFVAHRILRCYNKYLGVNPFISQREFNQQSNFSIPSSILIHPNKKQESPIFLLLQAGSWFATLNDRTLDQCMDNSCVGNSNYMEKLALFLYEHRNNELSRYFFQEYPFWLGYLPASLLKKRLEGLTEGQIIERNDFSFLVLLLISEYAIKRSGNLKDLQFAFSLTKEHAAAYIGSHMEDSERMLRYMIENGYIDCLKYYIGQMIEYNVFVSAYEWSNIFPIAIQRKDPEIFSALLLCAKTDQTVFAQLKSDEEYKYTFLAIAERNKEKNSEIIKILIGEGFVKSPQEEKSTSSDKGLSEIEKYSDQSPSQSFEERPKKRKETNFDNHVIPYDHVSDFFKTISRDSSKVKTDKAPEIVKKKKKLHIQAF